MIRRTVSEDIKHWHSVFMVCHTQSSYYPTKLTSSEQLINILSVMDVGDNRGVYHASGPYFIVPTKQMKEAIYLLELTVED